MQNLEGKLICTRTGNKYLLTELAGEGAQGVVYNEASDKYLIKLYKRGSPIQNTNKLNKLNWLKEQDYPDQFIKPLDIIEEPYVGYVMQKVKKHISLNRLLIPDRDTSFSEWYNKETGGLRRRLFIAYKIAMQFAMLHNTNRAYCDISGNNILVNENTSIVSVCMIDIDNIYIPGGDSGNVLGTSRYMAPEIMNKEMPPDIFTDSYSLAVILFELLRVGHPYIGDLVDEGTPEQQTQAYLGLYPYVDDQETDINRSTQMLPERVVFTHQLADLFRKTFVEGKNNRVERVPAREFALALLDASNKVMKCPECGNWHLAVPNDKKQYICPWCDAINEKPLFLQFKDRCDISREMTSSNQRKVFKDVPINSFVLRDERNVVTNNYISNFYVRRDKFARPISEYFTIRKATDGKFYLINSKDNDLFYQKKDSNSIIRLGKNDRAVEVARGDRIFFEDICAKQKKKVEKSNYEGILFRYAIIR